MAGKQYVGNEPVETFKKSFSNSHQKQYKKKKKCLPSEKPKASGRRDLRIIAVGKLEVK